MSARALSLPPPPPLSSLSFSPHLCPSPCPTPLFLRPPTLLFVILSSSLFFSTHLHHSLSLFSFLFSSSLSFSPFPCLSLIFHCPSLLLSVLLSSTLSFSAHFHYSLSLALSSLSISPHLRPSLLIFVLLPVLLPFFCARLPSSLSFSPPLYTLQLISKEEVRVQYTKKFGAGVSMCALPLNCKLCT